MTETNLYQPSLKKLLDKKEDDWGDPLENQMSMVLYGIPELDKALYGINVNTGELILIRGQQKRRKTTLFLNILANIYLAPIPDEKPTTVIDVLESGMTPERYRDSLLSIVSTKILMKQGHIPGGICPVCGKFCKELKITPDYLRYQPRTKVQLEAVEEADSIMSNWPIFIFGAHEEEGNTRSLDEALFGRKISSEAWHVRYGLKYGLGTEKELKEISRWEFLRQHTGAKIFGVDHIQQYDIDGRELDDYKKQQVVVGIESNFVAQKKIVLFAISQVSLTSVRDARQGSGRAMEAGGTKASSEANVILSPQYSFDDRGVMYIVLEESRRAPTFSVKVGIEAASGAFYGTPETIHERVFISD